MEVRLSIQVGSKYSLISNGSPGLLEFMDLPHGIQFFQGRQRILHPLPCMDIKWNNLLQSAYILGVNCEGTSY